MSPVFNRQSLLNVAKSLVFCALLLAMLGAAQVLLTPTPGTVSPWAAVRETRGEADVLVLGSSRAYCSVLPMEMWRDSGITALDVTSGSLGLGPSLQYLKQASESHSPKVVMLEAHMVGRAESFEVIQGHGAFDYMPSGLPRTSAIVGSIPPGDWFELFFPLQAYHSRWNGLGQYDYLPDKLEKYGFARGAMYLPQVKPLSGAATNLDVTEQEYQADLPHVRRIAREVESSGGQLVVFLAPSTKLDTVDGDPILDRLKADLSTEFPGVAYVDMNTKVDELGIDPSTDYKDEQHLNHRGAVKMTRWVTGFLTDEYQLADRRTEPLSADWNAALSKYDEMFKPSW